MSFVIPGGGGGASSVQAVNYVASGQFGSIGTADDSATIIAAINDAVANNKTVVSLSGRQQWFARELPIVTGLTYDLGGSTIKLPNGAAANSNIFTGQNFATLIGTNGTGGVYRWLIQNGYLDGNGSNNVNGGHGIAVYGVGTIQNIMVHDTRGMLTWVEWSNTASQLEALGLAQGDQTFRLINYEGYNCYGRNCTVTGFDQTVPGGITGVTNVVNPTITTAQMHSLRVGQTITISGVVGAVGVNNTWVVASVPTATTFTITTGAPGAYTSGGAITFSPLAAVLFKGIDSPHLLELEIYQDAVGIVAGMFGLVVASPAPSCTQAHVYQNFPGAILVTGGNNTSFRGVYVGGHDRGLVINQNNFTVVDVHVDGSFANSIGIDYQSVGGSCFISEARYNGLISGSVCLRIWNTSHLVHYGTGVGDGGTNTSTLYVAPNGTGGFHGTIWNNGNGVNAAPATLTAA